MFYKGTSVQETHDKLTRPDFMREVEDPKMASTDSESNDAMISFRLVKGPKFKIISLISC